MGSVQCLELFTEAFRLRRRVVEATRAECAVVDQLAGQVAAQAGVRVGAQLTRGSCGFSLARMDHGPGCLSWR